MKDLFTKVRTARAPAARRFSRVFSPGRTALLKELGHDFLEGSREGPYLFDEKGSRYLDCVTSGGVFNLGRVPAEVGDELVAAAAGTDQGNFPMISSEKAALAEALAAFAPGGLDCSVFSVMRGEALEFACKAARGLTQRHELVTASGGWYGETGFALSLSERADKRSFGPLIPGVRSVPWGDLAAVERAIGRRTAAFVLAPIQAENGCRVAQEQYLRGVRRLCTRRGVVLILDETQSGFGRTGRRFACEHASVVPDILLLGEALGAGIFPIAAALVTQRVNSFMESHPMIHLSTFGGSDVGCRVAYAALKVYERVQPWVNAARVGRRVQEGLFRLRTEHPGKVLGVGGRGLLLAMQMDSVQSARGLCRRAAERGLFIVPGRVAADSVVIRPSLLLTDGQADDLIEGLARSV